MNWPVVKRRENIPRHGKARSVVTIRNFFSAGLVTLLVTVSGLVATVSRAPANPSVILESSQEVVKIGERFFVDVYIDTSRPINAVSIKVQHSSNVEVESLREGESVLNIWTEQPSVGNGVITLSGGTFRRGFTGKHRIISIQARARDEGRVEFSVRTAEAVAGDGAGTEIPLEKPERNLTIAVKSETLTTETSDRLLTDLTGDGRVTLQDISIFMAAWHSKDTVYDFTGNGKMTFRDFSILLSDFFRFR